jgi:hypothetical protein
LIEGLPPAFPVFLLSYLNSAVPEIQPQHLVAGLYLYVVFLSKNLGCPGNKPLFFVDDPADVIGYASGGVGSVGTGFKYDDLQILSAPPGLRSGAHSRCISSDNNQSLCSHLSSLCDHVVRSKNIDIVLSGSSELS